MDGEGEVGVETVVVGHLPLVVHLYLHAAPQIIPLGKRMGPKVLLQVVRHLGPKRLSILRHDSRFPMLGERWKYMTNLFTGIAWPLTLSWLSGVLFSGFKTRDF